MIETLKQVKRLIIIVVGFTVLILGVIMIVLPGPAILVIPAGLAILATEFAWARRLLEKIKSKFRKAEKSSGETDSHSPRTDRVLPHPQTHADKNKPGYIGSMPKG